MSTVDTLLRFECLTWISERRDELAVDGFRGSVILVKDLSRESSSREGRAYKSWNYQHNILDAFNNIV